MEYETKCRVILHTILSAFSLLLTLCIFTACSGATNSEVEGNAVSLNKISWCNHQTTMVFTDDRAPMTPTAALQGTNTSMLGPATGTPVTLNNWNALKTYLGFVVFLPTNLPSGSCLLSASGSVRNAVSGSNFTLTYLLPDQTSLTIAQVPQHEKNTAFQCSTLPNIASSLPESNSLTQANGTSASGVQLCTGTHGTTNITFSAHWNKQRLQQFFQDLQPNVNWIPRS